MLATLSIDCLLMVADKLTGTEITNLWRTGDVRLQAKLCNVKTVRIPDLKTGRPSWSHYVLSQLKGLEHLYIDGFFYLGNDKTPFDQRIEGLPQQLKTFVLYTRSSDGPVLKDLAVLFPRLEKLRALVTLQAPLSLPPTIRVLELFNVPHAFQELLDLLPVVETLKLTHSVITVTKPLSWPPYLSKLTMGLYSSKSEFMVLPPTLTVVLLTGILDSKCTEDESIEPLLRLPSVTSFVALLRGFPVPRSVLAFPTSLRHLSLRFRGSTPPIPEDSECLQLINYKRHMPLLEVLLFDAPSVKTPKFDFELSDDNYLDFPDHWATVVVDASISSTAALKALPQGLKQLTFSAKIAPLLKDLALPSMLHTLIISHVKVYESSKLSCGLPSTLRTLEVKSQAIQFESGGFLTRQTPFLTRLVCNTANLPDDEGFLAIPRNLPDLRLTLARSHLDPDDFPLFQLEKLWSGSCLPPALRTLTIDWNLHSPKIFHWIGTLPPKMPLQELSIATSASGLEEDTPPLLHHLPSLTWLWVNSSYDPQKYLAPDSNIEPTFFK